MAGLPTSGSDASPIPRPTFAIPCALFLGLFGYFLSGLSGTIPSYRDSGDLIAAVHNLGIAHPPGYPGYVVLGRLWSAFLPAANLAYRLNAFSAAAGALAGTLLYLLFLRLLARRHPEGATQPLWPATGCALIAALVWGTSPATVELSRVSEMYAPAAAMAAGLLLLLVKGGQARALWAASFIWALALTMHPTLLFLAPILFFWAWRLRGEIGLRPLFVGMGITIAIGLTLWLFLPVRAFQFPWVDWGHPTGLRSLWRVMTRADYGGLKLHPAESVLSWSFGDVNVQLRAYLRALLDDVGLAGVLLGAFGMVGGFLAKRSRAIHLGFAVAWGLSGPLFFVLSNLPLEAPTTPAILQPYLLLSGLLWCFFAAHGLFALTRLFNRPFLVGGVLAGGAIALSPLARPMAAPSHRQDFYAYDYGRNLMRSLPPNAVLFDPDDPTSFTIRAMQATERRRLDLVPLNFFRTRWGYETIRRRWPDLLPAEDIPNAQYLQSLFWNYSIRRRPFFVELPQKLEGHPYRSAGIVYAVYADRTSWPTSRAIDAWSFYVLRGDAVTRNHPDFFTRHLLNYYAAARSNLGIQMANENTLDRAVAQYKAALVIDPDLAAAYNNWGIVEYQRGRFVRAIALYTRATQIEPRNAGFQRNLKLAQDAAAEAEARTPKRG
jgi:hypothetical protein